MPLMAGKVLDDNDDEEDDYDDEDMDEQTVTPQINSLGGRSPQDEASYSQQMSPQ